MFWPLALGGAAWYLWRRAQAPKALPGAKAQFAERVYKVAAPICARYGVPVAVCVAQACLESAWGRAMPGGNPFGIKGKGPAGTVNVKTREEFTPGQITKIRDNFAAYSNLAQAVEAWAQFVTRGQYGKARGLGPAEFSIWIWARGYATAGRYVQALAAVSRQAAQLTGRPQLGFSLTPAQLGAVAQLGQAPAGGKRRGLAAQMAQAGQLPRALA